jgi:RNA polymerase sigma factor for flagellar operon FliA
MKKQKIHNLDLWEKFQNEKNKIKKDKLRNQLIEIYYPLVQKISYKVATNLAWHVQPEELSSFGVDGLYSAVERFSLDAGVDFPAFANRRIGGSMIDGVRKDDIVPRSVRTNNNLFEKTRSEMETTHGRKVTEFEIIEKLGISQEEYLKDIKKYKPTGFVSLDGTDICNNEQEDYKKDSMSSMIDKKSISPDNIILRKEFLNKLISKNFSKIEQKIIYYYYYDNLTMEEISDKLDISESRVSQLHSNVIPRLKNKIERNPVFFENKEIYVEGSKNIDPLY